MIKIPSEMLCGLSKDQFLAKWIRDGRTPLELQRVMIKNRTPVAYTTVRKWLTLQRREICSREKPKQ